MTKNKPISQMTPKEYYEFLWTYQTFDKTREQLIKDLELSPEAQKFLDEALEYCKSRVKIHKEEGLPSPSFAFYLMEYIEDELDLGVPKEITEKYKKAASNERE